MKRSILFLIVFCIMQSLTYYVKSSRMIIQENYENNYYKIINNFHNWCVINPYGLYNVGSICIDSTDSHRSTLFFQKESSVSPKVRNQFYMHIALTTKFLLPFQEKFQEYANINLTYISENLKNVKLITSLFDKEENKILSDTLTATCGNVFLGRCSKSIPLKDARFFYLELITEGIDSTYWDNRKGLVDSTCNQQLWIHEIDIELDGKGLKNFSEKEILPPCKINPQSIIPIIDENSFEHIPELKEKKIIAIGESVHGSEAFDELFVQMVKYLVNRDQCGLILLEWDMSEALMLNGFIQGHEGFDIDSLLYEMRYSLSSNNQLKDMLLFLKDHNQTAKEKVWLMGIDFSYSINSNLNAAKYLYAINENHHYKQIDSLCYELITKQLLNIVNFQQFENHFWFQDIMNHTERQLFLVCFWNYARFYANRSESYQENAIIREKRMFENSEKLIDFLCDEETDKKVLIYGHSAHLNNKYIEMNNSYGQYMKEFYGDQYSNICLIVNKGEFRSTYFPDGNKLDNYPLRQHDKSIEFALSNFTFDCMYVPVKSLTVPHISIRNIGGSYENGQFMIVSPSFRYDAFIYKHYTEATPHLYETKGTIYEPISLFNEQRQNLYEKIIKKIEPY